MTCNPAPARIPPGAARLRLLATSAAQEARLDTFQTHFDFSGPRISSHTVHTSKAGVEVPVPIQISNDTGHAACNHGGVLGTFSGGGGKSLSLPDWRGIFLAGGTGEGRAWDPGVRDTNVLQSGTMEMRIEGLRVVSEGHRQSCGRGAQGWESRAWGVGSEIGGRHCARLPRSRPIARPLALLLISYSSLSVPPQLNGGTSPPCPTL